MTPRVHIDLREFLFFKKKKICVLKIKQAAWQGFKLAIKPGVRFAVSLLQEARCARLWRVDRLVGASERGHLGGITDTQGEDRGAWIGALRSSGDDEESQALYAPLPLRLLPQEQGSPPLPLTPSGVWLLPPSLVLIQIGQA